MENAILIEIRVKVAAHDYGLLLPKGVETIVCPACSGEPPSVPLLGVDLLFKTHGMKLYRIENNRGERCNVTPRQFVEYERKGRKIVKSFESRPYGKGTQEPEKKKSESSLTPEAQTTLNSGT